MKGPTGLLLAAVVLGVALGAPSTTPPAEVDQQQPPPARAFTAASCDENDVAFDVEPDTAEARRDAQDWCTKSGEVIDNAPWPSGFTPAPLPEKRTVDAR